eukprot:CAMPEP_0170579038 /NCGR_PEP_ID=MMETSP0224-20130122/5774_1 /TAXON_ID=285029 /ORGANISM="Togula jolla, Strain CCCM 725" /LENGTH=174 /DNA_ID=CAMNT_0010902043 /DNA_START=15 /DNA_END=540 /DNA_ORIENTATION=+
MTYTSRVPPGQGFAKPPRPGAATVQAPDRDSLQQSPVSGSPNLALPGSRQVSCEVTAPGEPQHQRRSPWAATAAWPCLGPLWRHRWCEEHVLVPEEDAAGPPPMARPVPQPHNSSSSSLQNELNVWRSSAKKLVEEVGMSKDGDDVTFSFLPASIAKNASWRQRMLLAGSLLPA